ncbi:MAG TPA: hypothetical protein VHU84_05645 [Lacipirellulaceae bacterium]|jgi:hypothetical protein|nr:hypothetical protein [Lacipirellulaceae bacterium]
MSEVRLVLRDRERDLSGTIHGSIADCAIAALSAEPETIDELEVAMRRFHTPAEHRFFPRFHQGVDDEAHDAGLVVIDLAARLIVCDSTYSMPLHSGSVSYHDRCGATNVTVPYHLPEDWKISRHALGWSVSADERREKRCADPPLDTRAVLLGKAALEFIVRECFAAFRDRRGEPPSKETFYGDESIPDEATAADLAAIREIHARWLTTPREDLRGQTPRDVLLARKEQISWDMQDRSQQWSALNECPPPIDKASWAYRHAGFGTHQTVIYYDLIRFLLWSSYRSLLTIAESNRAMMSVSDFLATEVLRLAEMREEYLDAANPEYSGRTPRAVMENERARIPEGISGHEAMIDCDCPLCQMQAEMPGPVFWFLDGCNMDDDFAFSFHRTKQEWDEEQRKYEEWNRHWRAREDERKRLGIRYPDAGYSDPDDIWQRSFVAPESAEASQTMRLFAIGSLLCELTTDLKEPVENRMLIERLSRDWGNLREVVGATEACAQLALVDAVVDRFCQSLAEVAVERGDLEFKCRNLTDRLRRFMEPANNPGDDFDSGNGGNLPF